jgi:hypothetical protein
MSSGLVGFVWLMLMLRDANLAAGRRDGFPLLSKVFLVSLIVYFTLFVLIISLPFRSAIRWILVFPDALLAGVLLCLMAALVVTTQNRIDAALGSTPSIRGKIGMIALTFAWFISLPILQMRLNRLAERGGAA